MLQTRITAVNIKAEKAEGTGKLCIICNIEGSYTGKKRRIIYNIKVLKMDYFWFRLTHHGFSDHLMSQSNLVH